MISGVASDVRARRYPRALIVAVASWVLLAVVLLFSTKGAPTPSNQNPQTQDAIDTLNMTQIAAPTGQTAWWFPWLPALGVLVLIAAVLLMLGYGWTRLVLALLGLVAVVALAQSGSPWLAIVAAVLFVVACVCGLLVSAHRYLRDGSTGSTGQAAEERVQ